MKLLIYSLLFCFSIFAPSKEWTVGKVHPNLRWTIGMQSADLDRVKNWFATAKIVASIQNHNQASVAALDFMSKLSNTSVSHEIILNNFSYLFLIFFSACEYGMRVNLSAAVQSNQIEYSYENEYQTVLHPIFLYLSKQFKDFVESVDANKVKNVERKSWISKIAQESYGYEFVGQAPEIHSSALLWSRDDCNNLFCYPIKFRNNFAHIALNGGANLLGNATGVFKFLFIDRKLIVAPAHLICKSKNHAHILMLNGDKIDSKDSFGTFYFGKMQNFRGYCGAIKLSSDLPIEGSVIYQDLNTTYYCTCYPETEVGYYVFIGVLLQELKKIAIEGNASNVAQELIDDILQISSADLIKEENRVEEVNDDENDLPNNRRKDNHYVDRFAQEVSESAAIARENLKNKRKEAEIEFYEKWEAQVRAEQAKISAAVAGNKVEEIHAAQTSARQNLSLQTSHVQPANSDSKNTSNLNDDYQDHNHAILDAKLEKWLQNLPTVGRVKAKKNMSMMISIINAAQQAGIAIQSFQDGAHMRKVLHNPKTGKTVSIFNCELHGGKTLHANQLTNKVFEWIEALASII